MVRAFCFDEAGPELRVRLVPAQRMPGASEACFLGTEGPLLPMLILGTDYIRGEPVGIREEHLLRHFYLIGKTGSGKSTVLSHVLREWFKAGNGGALIDPHGDLVKEVLGSLPRKRHQDILLFDPADREFPVAWNPLFRVPEERRTVVAQGLVSAFKSVWHESWGPRMEYILVNALRLLLDAEQESLLGLQRLLTDDGYRNWLLRQCQDSIVVRFWKEEFGAWDGRFRREAVAPVQNKIGQFMQDPVIRNILGQRKSRVDLRFLMDRKRIILVSLSKGLIGEESANLLGSLLVSSIHEAALSRGDIPETERVPFLLAVDEFHNFTTRTFASSLAEVRKYGLGLVLSHQYLGQLSPEVRNAVLGNVGSTLVFKVGGHDALILTTEMGEGWPAERLADLGTFQACFRAARGQASVPLLIRTQPPAPKDQACSFYPSEQFTSRFTHLKANVESRIDQWLGRNF
jgi:hypothetical protein